MEEKPVEVINTVFIPDATGMRKVDEKALLQAILESEDGNKSDIAKRLGISRNCVCNYISENPTLAEAYNQTIGALGDKVESALMTKINSGDTGCIVFYCRTRLKDRGYIEKQQIEHEGGMGLYGNIRNHRIIEFRGLEPALQAKTAVAALEAHVALTA